MLTKSHTNISCPYQHQILPGKANSFPTELPYQGVLWVGGTESGAPSVISTEDGRGTFIFVVVVCPSHDTVVSISTGQVSAPLPPPPPLHHYNHAGNLMSIDLVVCRDRNICMQASCAILIYSLQLAAHYTWGSGGLLYRAQEI